MEAIRGRCHRQDAVRHPAGKLGQSLTTTRAAATRRNELVNNVAISALPRNHLTCFLLRAPIGSRLSEAGRDSHPTYPIHWPQWFARGAGRRCSAERSAPSAIARPHGGLPQLLGPQIIISLISAKWCDRSTLPRSGVPVRHHREVANTSENECRILCAAHRCGGLLVISKTGTSTVASPFSVGGDTAQERRSTAFESGQVRPLALSADGRLLFATNTPDNRLEIFRVNEHGLKHLGSVPVGLEPVAVAARQDDEVWVVNHLSDSVSIVDVGTPDEARVVRTLLVGDEPRDIVFAGPDDARVHHHRAPRPEHRARPAAHHARASAAPTSGSSTPTTSARRSAARRSTMLTLFADTPRALAVIAGRQARSTRRRSTPATRPPSIHRARSSTPNGGAARRRHQRCRACRSRRPA